MKRSHTLRLCTWNLWHALDPYQPIFMPPLESPWKRWVRRRRQIDALQALKSSELDIFCLQEVNPIKLRRKLLARKLEMRDFGCKVNSGIKIAGMGFPPLLSEGLVTLLGQGFDPSNSRSLTLSGRAPAFQGPLGIELSLQTAERRRALIVETQAHGRSLAIINLHLHHGNEEWGDNHKQRSNEIKRLSHWLKPRLANWDLVAVCGDFNCEPASPALAPLKKLGFMDLTELTDPREPLLTWDPEVNPLTRRSAETANHPQKKAWDGSPHCFDRIYLRDTQKLLKNVRIQRVFDDSHDGGAILSDHYGVLAEIELS